MDIGTCSVKVVWQWIEMMVKYLCLSFYGIYKRKEADNNGGCEDIKPSHRRRPKISPTPCGSCYGRHSRTSRPSPCDYLLSDPSTMQRGRGSLAALAGLIVQSTHEEVIASWQGSSERAPVTLDNPHQQSQSHDDTWTCTIVIHRRQAHIAGAWVT